MEPEILKHVIRSSLMTPSLDLDFAGTKQLDSRIQFTRSTAATQIGSSGFVEYAPENLLRNSTFAGAALGIIGSGGSIGTYVGYYNVSGLNIQILSTGTDGALPYVDVRVYGTSTSTGECTFYFDSTTLDAGSLEPWTISVYHKLLAGSSSGLNGGIRLRQINRNGSTYLGESNTVFNPTNDIARAILSSVTGTNTTKVQHAITFPPLATGSVVDMTVRFYAPQAERHPTARTYNPTTNGAYYGPRFTHQISTRTRTNLLAQSENFATWATQGGTWSNNTPVARPDGVLISQLFSEDATTGNHRTFQAWTVVSGTT